MLANLFLTEMDGIRVGFIYRNSCSPVDEFRVSAFINDLFAMEQSSKNTLPFSALNNKLYSLQSRFDKFISVPEASIVNVERF
jgi:hypothetical protein